MARGNVNAMSLSVDVHLPREAVTETFAILANKGKGKSNTATVFVEELYNQGLPVVVLDVKGDWWGLRSSRSGKDSGLPFVIFGGDHADVPLEPTAGEQPSQLEQRLPGVRHLDWALVARGDGTPRG